MHGKLLPGYICLFPTITYDSICGMSMYIIATKGKHVFVISV